MTKFSSVDKERSNTISLLVVLITLNDGFSGLTFSTYYLSGLTPYFAFCAFSLDYKPPRPNNKE